MFNRQRGPAYAGKTDKRWAVPSLELVTPQTSFHIGAGAMLFNATGFRRHTSNISPSRALKKYRNSGYAVTFAYADTMRKTQCRENMVYMALETIWSMPLAKPALMLPARRWLGELSGSGHEDRHRRNESQQKE